MMSLFVLPVLGIVIGVVATIIVGRYYFQRTIDKRLTPYIHTFSHVLAGIDQSVRQDLKILFRGEEVEDLTEIQFIIANDGQRAIRDCIKPLSLSLPKTSKLLDAVILHRRPSELDVRVTTSETSDHSPLVQLSFPLLNHGDYFLLKLLVKGDVNLSVLEFTILVDDLPPTIKPISIPLRTTESSPTRIVEWSAIGAGLFFVLLALGTGYGMFLLWEAKPSLFPYPWASFSPSWAGVIGLVVWAIGSILYLILGLLFCFGIGFDETFKKRRCFPLPEKYRVQDRMMFPPDFESRRLTASEIDKSKSDQSSATPTSSTGEAHS